MGRTARISSFRHLHVSPRKQHINGNKSYWSRKLLSRRPARTSVFVVATHPPRNDYYYHPIGCIKHQRLVILCECMSPGDRVTKQPTHPPTHLTQPNLIQQECYDASGPNLPHQPTRPPTQPTFRLTFGIREVARRSESSTSKGRRKAPNCCSSKLAPRQRRTNRSPPTPACTFRGRSLYHNDAVRSFVCSFVREKARGKGGRQRRTLDNDVYMMCLKAAARTYRGHSTTKSQVRACFVVSLVGENETGKRISTQGSK